MRHEQVVVGRDGAVDAAVERQPVLAQAQPLAGEPLHEGGGRHRRDRAGTECRAHAVAQGDQLVERLAAGVALHQVLVDGVDRGGRRVVVQPPVEQRVDREMAGRGVHDSSPASIDAAPQLVDAAMADHPHVAGREAELRADRLGRLLVVEGHHQHRPLALRQALEAVGDARLVEARRDVQVGHRQVVGIAFEQLGAPALAAALVHHREPAGAEHERQHPLRLAQLAGAQLRDGMRP